MKSIIELGRALRNEAFYNAQIEDDGIKRNILWIGVHASVEDLYRSLLPYYGLLESENNGTAMTSFGPYNPHGQLTNPTIFVTREQVLWADYIVMPFTAHPLCEADNDLYRAIRGVNPEVAIIYPVDCAYWMVPDYHPLRGLYTKDAIDSIDKNIWMADIVWVQNRVIQSQILKRINGVIAKESKTAGMVSHVSVVPILVSKDIMLANIPDELMAEPPVVEKAEQERAKPHKRVGQVGRSAKEQKVKTPKAPNSRELGVPKNKKNALKVEKNDKKANGTDGNGTTPKKRAGQESPPKKPKSGRPRKSKDS